MTPGLSGVVIWGMAFLLTAASILLTLARTALMNVSRSRLQRLAEEGDRAARRAEMVVQDSARFLVTLETSQVLLALAATALAVWASVPGLAGWFASVPMLKPYATFPALFLSLLGISIFMLLGVWLVPQSLALRHAEGLVLALSTPFRWIIWILCPVVGGLVRVGDGLGQFLGGSPLGTISMITEEAIKTLVDAGEERGVIEEEEKEMIYSIFELGDTVVREVMVPRIDIVAVEADTPILKALGVILEAGYSRIPVYEETIDNVIGLLYAKDLLAYLRDGRTDAPARDVLRAPYFVPETKRVNELLPDLQRRKVHVAIVVDEYGGVAGLVTIEDLLEEIVGEIQDEYDSEEPMVQMADDGALIFNARVPLDEVNKLMGIELVSEVADTLGGYVYEKLGHVPAADEQIVEGQVEITVAAVSGRRIRRVRVRRVSAEPAGEAAGKEGLDEPVEEEWGNSDRRGRSI